MPSWGRGISAISDAVKWFAELWGSADFDCAPTGLRVHGQAVHRSAGEAERLGATPISPPHIAP